MSDDDQLDDDHEDDLEDDDQGDDELDQDDDDRDDELVWVEVVHGLLERVAAAQRLSWRDEQDLGWLIGARPAGRLARALNREADQRRRVPRRRGGLLGSLFGGPQAPEVLPDSVGRVLLGVACGERVSSADLRRLTAVLGRRAARALLRFVEQAVDPGQPRTGRAERRTLTRTLDRTRGQTAGWVR